MLLQNLYVLRKNRQKNLTIVLFGCNIKFSGSIIPICVSAAITITEIHYRRPLVVSKESIVRNLPWREAFDLFYRHSY